jgi:hypothetical protein
VRDCPCVTTLFASNNTIIHSHLDPRVGYDAPTTPITNRLPTFYHGPVRGPSAAFPRLSFTAWAVLTLLQRELISQWMDILTSTNVLFGRHLREG